MLDIDLQCPSFGAPGISEGLHKHTGTFILHKSFGNRSSRLAWSAFPEYLILVLVDRTQQSNLRGC